MNFSKANIVALSLVLWISAYSILFFVTAGDEAILPLALALGAIPLGASLALYGLPRFSGPQEVFLVLLIGSMILSGLTNEISIGSVGAIVSMTFVIVVAAVISAPPREKMLGTALKVYGLVTTALLLMVLIDGDYRDGRLFGRLTPNYWGAVALSGFAAAFAYDRRILRWLTWMVTGFAMLQTSSRSSMLAALAVAGVYMLTSTNLKQRSKKVRMFFNGAALFVLVAAVFLFDPAWDLFSAAFQLESDERGLGSGLTGRFDGRIDLAVKIFADNPLLGVGYRAHEPIFLAHGFSSVHNGYLAVLLDTGMIGFAIYAAFLGSALYFSGYAQRVSRIHFATFGIIVAYAISSFFERRALNAGNAFSILFVAASFYALSGKSLWRSAPRKHPVPISLRRRATQSSRAEKAVPAKRD